MFVWPKTVRPDPVSSSAAPLISRVPHSKLGNKGHLSIDYDLEFNYQIVFN